MYMSGTLGCPILPRPTVSGQLVVKLYHGLTSSCKICCTFLLSPFASLLPDFFLSVAAFGVISFCFEETYFNLHCISLSPRCCTPHTSCTIVLCKIKIKHVCLVRLPCTPAGSLSPLRVNTEQILTKAVLSPPRVCCKVLALG